MRTGLRSVRFGTAEMPDEVDDLLLNRADLEALLAEVQSAGPDREALVDEAHFSTKIIRPIVMRRNRMSVLDEVLKANADYAASFGSKGELALPPARGFAILTCMDARLDPAKYAGLAEGDAHVIRNAGGRASDDAIRSLVISYKLLGTRNGS